LQLLKEGKNNQGPMPIYFNHQELINVLKNHA